MSEIRKIHVTLEETRREGGREVDPPLKLGHRGCGDAQPLGGAAFWLRILRPEIRNFANGLGALLVDRLVEALGSAESIEAYREIVGSRGRR